MMGKVGVWALARALAVAALCMEAVEEAFGRLFLYLSLFLSAGVALEWWLADRQLVQLPLPHVQVAPAQPATPCCHPLLKLELAHCL